MIGIRQTSLNIDEYFRHREYKESDIETPMRIVIELDPPAITNQNRKVHKLLLVQGNKFVNIDEYDEKYVDPEMKECLPPPHQWKPKTHMIDWETSGINTKNPVIIGEGQGIGVFISDIHKGYVKLIYDKKSRNGIQCLPCGWNHGRDAKKLLSMDLAIGYNVLLLNNKWNDLMERLDDQNQRKDHIVVTEIKQHHFVNSKKRKRDSDSDDEEEENRIKKKRRIQ